MLSLMQMGHCRLIGWLHPGLSQLRRPGSVVRCPLFSVCCVSWALAEESFSFLSLLKAGSVVGRVSQMAQFPQVRGLQPLQYSQGINWHSLAGVPFFVFQVGVGSSGGSLLFSGVFSSRGWPAAVAGCFACGPSLHGSSKAQGLSL